MKKLKSILVAMLLSTMLCISCHADNRTVEFEWEQDIGTEDDFAGWKLYMSNVSGEDYAFVENGTTPAIPLTFIYDPATEEYTGQIAVNVPVGVDITYYFVLTAVDTSGQESEHSNEASKTFFIVIPTTIPTTTTTIEDETPVPPENFRTVMLEIIFRLGG